MLKSLLLALTVCGEIKILFDVHANDDAPFAHMWILCATESQTLKEAQVDGLEIHATHMGHIPCS